MSGGSGHRGPHIQRVVTLTASSYCYTATETGTLSTGGVDKGKLGRDRDLIVIRRDLVLQGRIQGGRGVLGVRTSPFWGTLKLHKEAKNVACMCAKALRFST